MGGDEQSCFGQATEAAVVGGSVGAGLGAVQAAWEAKPLAGNRTLPLLVNTANRVGRSAGALAGCAAVFQATKCIAVDARGKDDFISSAFAGCAAGSTLALSSHRVIDAVSGCAALGAMAAFVKLAGNIRPESQTSTKFIQEAQKQWKGQEEA